VSPAARNFSIVKGPKTTKFKIRLVFILDSNFNNVNKTKCLLVVVLCISAVASGQKKYFKKWPAGSAPKEVGAKLTQHFIASPHTNFGGPGVPAWLTYPEVCTWYGALAFSETIKDQQAIDQLDQRFVKLITEEKKLLPNPGHVDNNVFGAVPFELFKQTDKQEYLQIAIPYADKQWSLPANPKPEYQRLYDSGYSWQTRLWIDDMYMITLVQAQAYRVLRDRKYIDRAAKQMVMYLDSIQRPNGLFFHAPDVPFFWGRGNGWMAAGMTELLRSLPEDNKDRPRILKGYQAMMASLKQFQSPEGTWRQLVDDSASWTETSGSAMFTYAMITGVKNGWLNEKEYGPVARKGWLALVSYIDQNGDLREVCEGTNKKNDRAHYLNRKRRTGDLHGQAPVLWCSFALLN
jgi:rhamnogalacturonyl hydrolase YesR